MHTEPMIETERQQFELFKRKLNLQAAQAQVSKMEYNLASPSTEKSALRSACQEATALKLGAICVLPDMVKPCAAFLGRGSDTSVIACISLPHGGDITKVKAAAVKNAIKDGADEVEVTVPISFAKEKNWGYIKREFKKLRGVAKRCTLRINVVSEVLTPEEIVKICVIASDCGINSIKTSYDADSISNVFKVVKDKCTIKADGVASVTDMITAVGMGAVIIGSKNAASLARLVLSEYEI